MEYDYTYDAYAYGETTYEYEYEYDATQATTSNNADPEMSDTYSGQSGELGSVATTDGNSNKSSLSIDTCQNGTVSTLNPNSFTGYSTYSTLTPASDSTSSFVSFDTGTVSKLAGLSELEEQFSANSSLRQPSGSTKSSGDSKAARRQALSIFCLGKTYSMCLPEDIDDERRKVEAEVMDMTGLSADASSQLLRSKKFNVEAVLEKLFENRAECLEQHHINSWAENDQIREFCSSSVLPTLDSFEQNVYIRANAGDEPTEVLCGVCFDCPTLNRLVTSPCGHSFCVDCWVGYLQSEVQTFRKALRLRCMDPSCKQILSDTQIKSIIFASLLLDGGDEVPESAFFDTLELETESESRPSGGDSTSNTSASSFPTESSVAAPLGSARPAMGTLGSTVATIGLTAPRTVLATPSQPSRSSSHIDDASTELFSPLAKSSSTSSSSNSKTKPMHSLLEDSSSKTIPAQTDDTEKDSSDDSKNNSNNNNTNDNDNEHDDDELDLIPVERLWPKYNALLRKAFCDEKRGLRYCSSPHCDLIIRGTSETIGVECYCGVTLCFRCGHEENHLPLRCTDLTAWSERCSKDSETAQWIMVNTRKCPKCRTRIEKNQGCNHMTCSNCQHEFCWVCDGDWLEHLREAKSSLSAYQCNKFDVKKAISNEQMEVYTATDEIETGKDGKTKTTKSKTKNKAKSTENPGETEDAQRYFFYFSRYHSMENMKKHSISMRSTINRHVQQLLKKVGLNMSTQDARQLTIGNEVLISARRALQYSYASIFCSIPTTEKQKRDAELFEYLQQRLEQSTEFLYALVAEKNMFMVDPMALKSRIAITKEVAENLLACME